MASRVEYDYASLPTRKPRSRSPTGRSISNADFMVDRLEEGQKTMEETRNVQQESKSFVAMMVSFFCALNLLLTFYNKSLLGKFPYPYFLTSLHAASGVIGCLFMRTAGVIFTPAQIHRREQAADREKPGMNRQGTSSSDASAELLDTSAVRAKKIVVVLMYSALYAANIAMSNASLHLVSLPFHQIVRSTCPLFTLILAYFALSKRPTKQSMIALAPVVVGAAVSCVGDSVRFTSLGVFLTVLGTFLAALKTVTTNVLQGGANVKTGEEGTASDRTEISRERPNLAVRMRHSIQRYAFHYTALELLEVMSPLAFLQCFGASYVSGELSHALAHLIKDGALDRMMCCFLIGNGTIAFLLNVVSFQTNKAAGPLTMTVVGNVKQVMTVVIAVYVYNLTITTFNAFGIVLALIGTAWYGAEGMRAKRL